MAVWCAVAGHGQTEKDPAFEVVSVKPVGNSISYGPTRPGSGLTLGLRYSPTRVAGNSQIFSMIEEAYALKAYQIVGPDWIRTEVYEIAATTPDGTSRDTAHRMLRAMLAARFGLRFHREQRDVAGYLLVEGKSGLKLHPVDLDQAKERVVDTPMGPQKGVLSFGGRGRYFATATTIGDFADWMSNLLDCPIVNQTHFAGVYAIDLRWPPNDPMELFSLIDRQLGLKLESRKIPNEMFVVDHVDKVPTQN